MDSARSIFVSDACEIDLGRQELRVQGIPAPLGGRAFEILEVLRKAAGGLVTKDELLNQIWGSAAVSENLLQVHISAVRKALGPYRSLLKTHSGRGYRLLGEWTIGQPASLPLPGPTPLRQPALEAVDNKRTNLPAFVTDLIGREAALPYLVGLLSAYRMVTLSGAGGIGKTTLALHAARELLRDFPGGAWLVELASLSDPALVPSTMASALGLKLSDTNSSEAIARSIGATKLLLVLDNCEHVIDAVAAFAETLVRQCPRLTILATSREVLRIGGEYVYRVPPLEVPGVDKTEAAELRSHSAVALFIARTQALGPIVLPQSATLPTIASICRRLDGMPLAIEFAAARAATLGIDSVHSELRNRFALLTAGRRTAVPRHQTLRATLDWSYELLPLAERQLLRRLSMISGSFGLEAAQALMGGSDREALAVAEGIANLVDKSLIMLDRADTGRWRLLETTRAYAAEKLSECGEAEETARRHAEFFLRAFESFGVESRLHAAIEELSSYRREVDNLRAALTWAFSPNGDTAIGIKLAATVCDFWIAESLVAECCDWCGKALDQIGEAAGSRYEMVLQCARGRALVYTKGMIGEALLALQQGLKLAEELDDLGFQQRANLDLWLFASRSASLVEALNSAVKLEKISEGRDIQFKAAADWIVGISLTYLADHVEAAHRLRRAVEQYPIERREQDLVRIGSDLRASATGHLTVNLVSMGELDNASQAALRAVAEARMTKHATVLCIALVWAGFTFITLGELNLAEELGEELIEHAYKHGMQPFHAAGMCIRGSVLAKRGQATAAIAPLRAGLAAMKETVYLLFYPFFVVELAKALAAAGRVSEALAEIDGALETAIEIDYRWLVPEIKRIKGEITILRDGGFTEHCKNLFAEALQQAKDQGALYWEFCASISVAESLASVGRENEAQALLTPLFNRLSQDRGTPMIERAEALLSKLTGACLKQPN